MISFFDTPRLTNKWCIVTGDCLHSLITLLYILSLTYAHVNMNPATPPISLSESPPNQSIFLPYVMSE